MAKTNNSNTPAQGGGSVEQNLLSDLERSELTEARNEALKDAQSSDPEAPNYVAPAIQQHGSEEPATLLAANEPEWVQTIIDSNAALIESNQKVIGALEDLKSFADQRSSTPGQPIEVKVQLIDEDEDYEVAPGKSFRDPMDFTKEYTEGDDVTHLGVIKLQSLLNSGLIVES